MPVSEARLRANRENSLRSTGPKTVEGKERSRQNGLKHGMTGQGVVLTPDDSAEVQRRNEAIKAELSPKSAVGAILVQQMALLSVRMERGAKQEFAAVATRVRHATEEFDLERVELAELLMETLGQDPRKTLKELMRMPEGVALMLEAWQDMRATLTHPTRASWSRAMLDKGASMMGLTADAMVGSRLEAISMPAWGNCQSKNPEAGSGMEDGERKSWARARLVEWIDDEVAKLEAHAASLDTTIIDQDRAEAADRALFDPSREASLARRYEAEARRGFFRALDEFRKAEAEVTDSAKSDVTEEPDKVSNPLASSRKAAPLAPWPIAASPGGDHRSGPDPAFSTRERKTVPCASHAGP